MSLFRTATLSDTDLYVGTSKLSKMQMTAESSLTISVPTGSNVDMPSFPYYLIGYYQTLTDDPSNPIMSYRIAVWTQDLQFDGVNLTRDDMFSYPDSISLRAIPHITDTSATMVTSNSDLSRSLVLKWKLERSINNTVWETAIDSSGFALNFLDGDYLNHPGHNVHSINALLQCLPERLDDTKSIGTGSYYSYRITAARSKVYRDPSISDLDTSATMSSSVTQKINYLNNMKTETGTFSPSPISSSSSSSNFDWTSDIRLAVSSYNGKTVASMRRVYSTLDKSSRKVFRIMKFEQNSLLDLVDGNVYANFSPYFSDTATSSSPTG